MHGVWLYIWAMSNCLTGADLKELGTAMLGGFDQRIARIPKDLSGPFHQEARQLEVELLTIYKVTVLYVRKEQDLKAISEAWGGMVSVCDEVAAKLNALSKAHPSCGAESYYDRVLDLRNKCNRLQMMHA